MNQNYIAPEVFNEDEPVCLNCNFKCGTTEQKIPFYQGTCPSCGCNPGVFSGKQKVSSFAPRTTRWESNYHHFTTPIQWPEPAVLEIHPAITE